MQRKAILTKDGSYTISVPEMKVAYHSVYGAIQESMHVFIEAGLQPLSRQPGKQIRIFEMGLGTGLNALLSLIEAEKSGMNIYYATVELFPLLENEMLELNYCEQLNRSDLQPLFEKLHSSRWNQVHTISKHFSFKKVSANFLAFTTSETFELCYYDAFAPAAQPELWTKGVFEKIYSMMDPDGVVVTYCAKGDVRRAMQGAGFTVEKIPGPRGKREMLRAAK